MARQKSEDRIKPQRRGNTSPTRARRANAGGKAIPVNEEVKQFTLFAESAEESAKAAADVRTVRHLRRTVRHAKPESADRREKAAPATIEAVIDRLYEAFENVARNRGAPGPDGMSIQEIESRLPEIMPKLKSSLLNGTYEPGNIRRKWIPKAGGGERGLGIPDVVDRMVQEAIRLETEVLYEPTFHASSHGFRPGRSCHTAIEQAVRYLEEGYEWVVDIDLEKFFDRVNHQRLMSKLAERVRDKRLLVLIGRMLKAGVVMPDGVVVKTEEGVPQGGPLSPLLSNVVLDELDRELEWRGHRFVRYADDANIYVKTERSGQRVMTSITRFIERRLRLKVNESKSAVARPEERHFLGFRLRFDPPEEKVEVLLSERTRHRIYERLHDLTPRNWGHSISKCIDQTNKYLVGWIGFFGICTAEAGRSFRNADAHIRRRLRAIQLKQWKRKRTIVKKLIGFRIKRATAWRCVYDGRKSVWALSHNAVVDLALRNSHWDALGLVSLFAIWRKMQEQVVVPIQLTLDFGMH